MNKKDVVLTLAVVGLSGCLYASDSNTVKSDGSELPQEMPIVQPSDRDIVFKEALGETTAHCYYWEPAKDIKK